jgi:hypothetical protein
MNAGYSRWIPSESGAGANETGRFSLVLDEIAVAGVTIDLEGEKVGAVRGAGSADRAKATAAAVPVANPRLKFRAVLLASGNFALHFVQVRRASEFAILHFGQNICTSTLL